MRTCRPWSPTWLLDRHGYFLPNAGVLWGFAFIAMFAVGFLSRSVFFATIFVVVASVLSLVVGTLASSIVEFFAILPGPRSAGVKGKERWVCDAMSGHISHGELIVTDEVAAFVPGAYRWSGKASKSEVEIVMPLCEIDRVERRRVYLLFPFGVSIVRTSGDVERFSLGRPRAVIREIEMAKAAWRNRVAAERFARKAATPLNVAEADAAGSDQAGVGL